MKLFFAITHWWNFIFTKKEQTTFHNTPHTKFDDVLFLTETTTKNDVISNSSSFKNVYPLLDLNSIELPDNDIQDIDITEI